MKNEKMKNNYFEIKLSAASFPCPLTKKKKKI